MKKKSLFVAAMLLVGSSAMGGGFDSPDGEPPYGLDFATGRSGTQLVGFATILFQGVTTEFQAERFDAVVHLRKGSTLEVFHAPYTCGATDPCGVCPDAPTNLIDMDRTTAIQHCVEELIQADVLAVFAPTATDLRLRDVSGSAGEVLGTEAVVGLDVEFTAK